MRRVLGTGCAVIALAVASLHAEPSPQAIDGNAASVHASFLSFRDSPDTAPFKEPLYLRSSQSSGALVGGLYALLAHPFTTVTEALDDPGHWCDLLILDPNIHRCRATEGGAGSADADVRIQLGNNRMPVAFAYRRVARSGDYLHIRLVADEGPFGTTDHRIELEVAPLDGDHSILHLTFSQHLGVRARLTMLAYFNTFGRGKVGFTVVDRDASGAVLVGDLRGGVERNIVRHYFAIQAYLASLDVPRPQQPEQRLRTWLRYIERYPLQLHEEPGYFERKRSDLRDMTPPRN